VTGVIRNEVGDPLAVPPYWMQGTTLGTLTDVMEIHNEVPNENAVLEIS
jgi:hypothetical protein